MKRKHKKGKEKTAWPKPAGAQKDEALKELFIDEDNITIIINGKKAASRKIHDYLTKEDYKFMDNEAYDFFIGFQDLHPDMKRYFDYNGLNMLDFVEEEFCFKSFMTYTIKDIVRVIGGMMKVIDAEEPFKVTVRDDSSFRNRIAILVSEKMGMKTAVRCKCAPKKIKNWLKSDLLSSCYEMYISLQKRKRRLFQKTARKDRRAGGILFLPYYANHVDVMNLVIRQLRQKKEALDVVCADNVFNDTKRRLKSCGLDHDIIEHYSSRRVMGIVRYHKKEFRKRWNDLAHDKKVQDSIMFRKIPLWGILKPRLKFLFMRRFVQVSEYLESTRHLISVMKPSLIVIANETSTYGRVAARAAELEELPSLLLQHGAVADDPRYNRIFSEKMAVEGSSVKDFFAKKGIPASKFIVTGQPRFDVLATGEGIPKREDMLKQLGIGNEKRVIVLATQVPDCDEKVVRAVYDAVKDMDDVMLVVKLHPAERTDRMYHRIRKETGIKNVVIGRDMNLYGLLNACELVMTVFSTTALEAMMMGKYAITINLTGEPDMMPYANSGAAIGVYKAEDLRGAIEIILDDAKTRARLKGSMGKLIHERAYRMDGKAAERVAELIMKTRKKN